MRKFVIALAASGAALAAASPAAAQYYPQPPVVYGAPYGNAYGYHNNWGQVRALQARVDRIERQIERLDRRDRIGERSADRLRFEADRIEHRLRRASRGGLNPYEFNELQVRIARLEQRVQFAVGQRYGYNAYGYNGYNGHYIDRDRDGRNDRFEDDRGWRRDRDRDDD